MLLRELSDDTLKKMTKDELVQHIVDIQTKSCMKSCKPIHPDITYRHLVESSSDIILVIDLNGNLVYYNEAALHIFGGKGLPLGERYSKYFKGMNLERTQEIFEAVTLDEETIENEIVRIGEDHSKSQYFNASCSPIRNSEGKVTGLVGYMKNITDLYKMEKKLKDKTHVLEEKVKGQIRQQEELERLYDFNQEIIKNVPIGIFMMDPSGIMLSENPKLAQIMGRSNQTVVGTNLLDYEGFQKSGFVELFERCLLERRPVQKNNSRYIPLSGNRELIITMSMFPILDKSGSVEKVVVMVEDNTDECFIVQQASKAQRKAVLGVFSSGVAHDIRNNVNQMFMDLNFVSNNIPEGSPAAEYLTGLKNSTERLKIISDELLSLSITEESGKIPCDLFAVLENPPLQPLLEKMSQYNISVNMKLLSERPQIFATPTQLQNVFKQIVTNARDAMPDGGELNISASIINEKDKKFAVMEIADTGIGISDENMNKIFKPFYTTKGKSATGLGLMIVCFILDNLQGTMAIKSKPGEGTTVRIVLPVMS